MCCIVLGMGDKLLNHTQDNCQKYTSRHLERCTCFVCLASIDDSITVGFGRL